MTSYQFIDLLPMEINLKLTIFLQSFSLSLSLPVFSNNSDHLHFVRNHLRTLSPFHHKYIAELR